MKKILLPFAVAALMLSSLAMAGTNTGTITAQSSIVPGCEVTANNLNFGDLSNLSQAKDATTTANVTCTPGVAYSVKIVDADDATNDDFTLKSTTGGADELSIAIYSDSTRTTLWNSTSVVSDTAGTSGDGKTYTLYGRVPAQDYIASGAYSDVFSLVVMF